MESSSQDYRWKNFGPSSKLPELHGTTGETETPDVDPHGEGYEAGFKAGEAAGLAAAEAQAQARLDALSGILQELTRVRGELIEQSFADMAGALRMLFERLFLFELRTDPGVLAALCDVMKEALQADDAPLLRLSKPDYDAVATMLPQLSGLSVSADETLPAGVMRAVIGKSVAELDIVNNLDQILKQTAQELPVDEQAVARATELPNQESHLASEDAEDDATDGASG